MVGKLNIMAMLDIPQRVVVYLCGLSPLDTCKAYLYVCKLYIYQRYCNAGIYQVFYTLYDSKIVQYL